MQESRGELPDCFDPIGMQLWLKRLCNNQAVKKSICECQTHWTLKETGYSGGGPHCVPFQGSINLDNRRLDLLWHWMVRSACKHASIQLCHASEDGFGGVFRFLTKHYSNGSPDLNAKENILHVVEWEIKPAATVRCYHDTKS